MHQSGNRAHTQNFLLRGRVPLLSPGGGGGLRRSSVGCASSHPPRHPSTQLSAASPRARSSHRGAPRDRGSVPGSTGEPCGRWCVRRWTVRGSTRTARASGVSSPPRRRRHFRRRWRAGSTFAWLGTTHNGSHPPPWALPPIRPHNTPPASALSTLPSTLRLFPPLAILGSVKGKVEALPVARLTSWTRRGS